MANVMVALAQDPARAEQAKALTAALPPERLLKALEVVSARPDAAAAFGNLTIVIPKEQLDLALASPGTQSGSVLGAALETIKNWVAPLAVLAPAAESASPTQPVQPQPGPATAPPQFVGTASP